MEEEAFLLAMQEEVKELSRLLRTDFPIPQGGNIQSLMGCMREVAKTYHILDESQGNFLNGSEEQLVMEEKRLAREKIRLQRILVQKASQSSTETNHQKANELPIGFASKPIEEIIQNLHQLEQETRVASLELDLEQIQEHEEELLQQDVTRFKDLANSLL